MNMKDLPIELQIEHALNSYEESGKGKENLQELKAEVNRAKKDLDASQKVLTRLVQLSGGSYDAFLSTRVH